MPPAPGAPSPDRPAVAASDLRPGHPVPTGQPTDDPWADDTWAMGLPSEQAALETLRLNWRECYEIGVDDGQWWYRRRDGKGGTETARTPDDLRIKIAEDYTIMPVRHQTSTTGKAIQWT